METFSASLAICVGNSPATGEFPAQRPVSRSYDVFFDLRLNKRLSKHSWCWWFETSSRPLWRQCNVKTYFLENVTTSGSKLSHRVMIADHSEQVINGTFQIIHDVYIIFLWRQTCNKGWLVVTPYDTILQNLNLMSFTRSENVLVFDESYGVDSRFMQSILEWENLIQPSLNHYFPLHRFWNNRNIL